MRSRSRDIIAAFVRHSRLGGLLRRAHRSSLVIVCYHRVLPDVERKRSPFPELVVSPEMFRQQVAFCAQHYHCLNLSEAFDRWQSGRRTDKPLLVFTFDDGYADNFQYARPILNECGVYGTFFVISSLCDTCATTWYDRLARATQSLLHQPSLAVTTLDHSNGADRWLAEQLNPTASPSVTGVVGAAKTLEPTLRLAVVDRAVQLAEVDPDVLNEPDKMMSRENLRVLVSEGHEIGAHTRTHPILTQLDDAQLADELTGARRELSETIDQDVTSTAYPNGDYDDRVMAATRRAGYRIAVSTTYGVNPPGVDPLALRRVFISQDRLADAHGQFSSNVFQLELSGVAEAVYLRNLRRGMKS